MSFQKVAVAGPTGNLGPSTVNALVDAAYQVTILSRDDKKYSATEEVSRVVKVDYTSLGSLTAALREQDAVVSTLPNHDQQEVLLDAAIAAGVKRFIPSEFACNIIGNSNTKYITERSDKISYTLIMTGLFLDWSLIVGFDIELKGATRVYDDGNTKSSTTCLSDIGKAVVGVLKHPEETKNRPVCVQSTAVTQNQLLDIAKKVNPSFSRLVGQISMDQFNKKAYDKLDDGDVGSAMLKFIMVGLYGTDNGNLWADKNDNELLGIQDLSEKQLEDIVAKYA